MPNSFYQRNSNQTVSIITSCMVINCYNYHSPHDHTQTTLIHHSPLQLILLGIRHLHFHFHPPNLTPRQHTAGMTVKMIQPTHHRQDSDRPKCLQSPSTVVARSNGSTVVTPDSLHLNCTPGQGGAFTAPTWRYY